MLDGPYQAQDEIFNRLIVTQRDHFVLCPKVLCHRLLHSIITDAKDLDGLPGLLHGLHVMSVGTSSDGTMLQMALSTLRSSWNSMSSCSMAS